jgi:hypothetical protein
MQGAAADSVVQNKIDFMTKAADYFKTKGCRLQEADMRMTIYNTRKSPNPGGLFNLGLNYFKLEILRKQIACLLPIILYFQIVYMVISGEAGPIIN